MKLFNFTLQNYYVSSEKIKDTIDFLVPKVPPSILNQREPAVELMSDTGQLSVRPEKKREGDFFTFGKPGAVAHLWLKSTGSLHDLFI